MAVVQLDSDAVPALKKLLKDKNATVRANATLALNWIGPPAFQSARASVEVLLTDESATPVTNDSLAALGHFSRLETLSIADTAVTDDGLRHLSGLRNLRKLHLSDPGITNSGLVALYGNTSLRQITAFLTNVTAEGMHELSQALPECCIMNWSNPTASGRNGRR